MADLPMTIILTLYSHAKELDPRLCVLKSMKSTPLCLNIDTRYSVLLSADIFGKLSTAKIEETEINSVKMLLGTVQTTSPNFCISRLYPD